MPTTSSEPVDAAPAGAPAAGTTDTHRHRAIAESFGVDPAGYDRWRPRYPQSLIDRIVTTSPGSAVLDVGIGTGIVARQLRDVGAQVTGVEPDARMAAFARTQGFPVEESMFEDWDPKGRTFDALVAGQTWHWVDPVAGAVKAGQVLRHGGRVAIFWNAGDAPPEINQAFADAFARAVPEWPATIGRTPPPAAQLYRTMADRAADGLRQAGSFDELEHWQDVWEQSYTRDTYLAVLPTQGTLTRVPADRAAPVLEAVGAAIDGLGGSFVMRYVTTTVTAIRTTTPTARSTITPTVTATTAPTTVPADG